MEKNYKFEIGEWVRLIPSNSKWERYAGVHEIIEYQKDSEFIYILEVMGCGFDNRFGAREIDIRKLSKLEMVMK